MAASTPWWRSVSASHIQRPRRSISDRARSWRGLIGISAILLASQGRLTGFPDPRDVTWGTLLRSLAAAVLVLSLLGYVLYITAIRHFVGEAGLSW